jgi:hypothetical protein
MLAPFQQACPQQEEPGWVLEQPRTLRARAQEPQVSLLQVFQQQALGRWAQPVQVSFLPLVLARARAQASLRAWPGKREEY